MNRRFGKFAPASLVVAVIEVLSPLPALLEAAERVMELVAVDDIVRTGTPETVKQTD